MKETLDRIPPHDRLVSGRVVTRYDYRDESGELLFQTERHEPKDFRQRRPDPDRPGKWICNLEGAPRVLYRLPELRAGIAAGDTVYLCEGEKDADALAALGVCATTAPMGAGAAWLDDYTRQLVGAAHVMILPDNDDPGRAHAEKVAAAVTAAGIEVRIVKLPGLSEHGDVSDWLKAGGTREQLGNLADRADVWLPPAAAEGATFADRGEPTESRKQSQADRLVAICRELYELGVTEASETFAVPVSGPRIATRLRGTAQSLRAELAREYFTRYGKSPGSTALADALTTIQGFAQLTDPTTLYLRYAVHDAALWFDLGTPDGAAVRVDLGGWEIVNAGAPATFYRTALTKAMPRPVPGGSFGELREYVNVGDDGWSLVEGVAVAALFPDAPQPILIIAGEQGTGKSGVARQFVAVLDPSTAPLRTAPRDATEWAVTAAGSTVIALDNLSSVPAWLSDCLCRAVTGDGLVRRQLYSDGDLVVTSFRKTIVLTAIDTGPLSADLIDRAVFVELQRIPAKDRKLDADIERDFAEAHGRILGGLLDLVSATMRHQHRVGALDGLPRMADHAYVLAALDLATGGDHLGAYMRASARAMVDASEGNPVVEAILEFTNGSTGWTGAASELYQLITPTDHQPRSWPRTAHHLSGMLKRLAPVLRARGVNVESVRAHSGRTIVLERDADVSRDAGDADSQLLLEN